MQTITSIKNLDIQKILKKKCLIWNILKINKTQIQIKRYKLPKWWKLNKKNVKNILKNKKVSLIWIT